MRTQEGTVLGTVPYMLLEQVAGRGVDPRSDIFSRGIVLFEVTSKWWKEERHGVFIDYN